MTSPKRLSVWNVKAFTEPDDEGKTNLSLDSLDALTPNVNEVLQTQLKINFHPHNELSPTASDSGATNSILMLADTHQSSQNVLMRLSVAFSRRCSTDNCSCIWREHFYPKNIKFLNRIMFNLCIQCLFVSISYHIYSPAWNGNSHSPLDARYLHNELKKIMLNILCCTEIEHGTWHMIDWA